MTFIVLYMKRTALITTENNGSYMVCYTDVARYAVQTQHSQLYFWACSVIHWRV